MFSTFKETIKIHYQKHLINKAGIWFIDIPKTSSTSIRNELGNKYGSPYIKSKSQFSIAPHRSSNNMISFLGHRAWESLFTFSIVRNPRDKTLSYFLWGQRNGWFKDMIYKDFVFEIRKQFEKGSSDFNWHGPYASCSYYLISEKGDLNVDFVGKFENRTEDLEIIRNKINNLNKNKKLNLKEFGSISVNNSSKYNRDNYYSNELVSIISKVYIDDLVNFNYKESDYFKTQIG